MISVQEALEIHNTNRTVFRKTWFKRFASFRISSTTTISSIWWWWAVIYSNPKMRCNYWEYCQKPPFRGWQQKDRICISQINSLNQGVDIEATQDDKYQLVMKIAENQVDFDEIVKWLGENTNQDNKQQATIPAINNSRKFVTWSMQSLRLL